MYDALRTHLEETVQKTDKNNEFLREILDKMRKEVR